MIRIIRWLLIASTAYSYLAVRAVIRLPLLLPIRPHTRNEVAGTLAASLWFLGLYVVVAAAGAPWWGQLIVAAAAALVITWTVCMEGRRALW